MPPARAGKRTAAERAQRRPAPAQPAPNPDPQGPAGAVRPRSAAHARCPARSTHHRRHCHLLPTWFPQPGRPPRQVCWVVHARQAPVHGLHTHAAAQGAHTLSGGECNLRLQAPYGAAQGVPRWLDRCHGHLGAAGRHQPPQLLVGRGAQGPAWPRPRSACSARAPASSAPGRRAPQAARRPQTQHLGRPPSSRQRRLLVDRPARARPLHSAPGRAQLVRFAHARQLQQPLVHCRAPLFRRCPALGSLQQARPARALACSADRGRGAAPALRPQPQCICILHGGL